MKKRKVFAVISAMVMSVSVLFTTGISAKAEESGTATLTVYETGYEEIVGMHDGAVVAKKNGKYGIAKLDGTEVVPFKYEKCEQFNNKYGIYVFSNEFGENEYHRLYEKSIFNSAGKLLYHIKEDYNTVLESAGITISNTGMIFVGEMESGDMGSIVVKQVDSTTGEVIEEFSRDNGGYDNELYYAGGWSKGMLFLSKYRDGKEFWFFHDGNSMKELQEDYGEPFSGNGDYIFLSQKTSWSYPMDITIRCYQISTGKYYKINSFHMESEEDDKWFGTVGNNIEISNQGGSLYALYDINGKAITEEKYTYIEGTTEIKDYYLVSDSNNKWFYIDSKGKEYGTDLKDAGSFYGGHAIVLNNDGEAYIIDESFNKVSESVKAEGVTSYNDNLFSITVGGLRYPVVMNKAAGTGAYEVNVTADKAISAADFTALLTENKTKDVVIKTDNDITFTFAKGTMKAVDGKDSYDFSAVINKDYGTVTGLPAHVTKDNFISLIDYKYSGQLPAEASIRIPVGKDYAGKTLYYSQLLGNSSISLVSSVVVDAEGYVTVKQSHCSSYILTSSEPNTPAKADGNGQGTSPQTGDTASVFMWFVLAAGAVVVTYRKVRRA